MRPLHLLTIAIAAIAALLHRLLADQRLGAPVALVALLAPAALAQVLPQAARSFAARVRARGRPP